MMSINPPAYDEVIQMDSVSRPTAPPLLSDQDGSHGLSTIFSLHESLFQLPETVKLRLSGDDSYTFYVRDARNECVLIRGQLIGPETVELFNANGRTFLKIISNRIEIDGRVPGNSAKHALHADVMHSETLIGKVECNESNINGISASNLYNNYHFLINCMGSESKDIVISRAWNNPPLCTANIPSSQLGYGPTSFNATLVFASDPSSITKVEQCMCFAIILSLIQTRNNVRMAEDFKEIERVRIAMRAELAEEARSQYEMATADTRDRNTSHVLPMHVKDSAEERRSCGWIIFFVIVFVIGILIWALVSHLSVMRRNSRS